MLRRFTATAIAGLIALTAAACASGPGRDATTGSVRVVAAFYPLQFVAEQVGGDEVAVTGLARPGVAAHDLELTPSQLVEVAEADLAIYLAGFQPAVDDAVTQHAHRALDVATVVPLLTSSTDDHDHDHDHDHDGEHAQEDDHPDEGGEGHDHGPYDPHVWLDPQRLATLGAAVAEHLSAVDPDNARAYADRAARLGDELAALDDQYAEGLAACERRELVVSHAAFGYLADRYDLRQIALTGLSPEDEPTPQRMGELIRQAREHGATTIFFEVLVSPDVADRIATDVGATTAVLDPIEGLAAGSEEDYFSLMLANLDTLRTALGCT